MKMMKKKKNKKILKNFFGNKNYKDVEFDDN